MLKGEDREKEVERGRSISRSARRDTTELRRCVGHMVTMRRVGRAHASENGGIVLSATTNGTTITAIDTGTAIVPVPNLTGADAMIMCGLEGLAQHLLATTTFESATLTSATMAAAAQHPDPHLHVHSRAALSRPSPGLAF